MSFQCNVCGGRQVGRELARGDGAGVLFCSECDMGVVSSVPPDTSVFYGDNYYGAQEGAHGYHDYEFTADHSLLWIRLLVEAMRPAGRVLDVGCATGHLLRSLAGDYQRCGIEVNAQAAAIARSRGVDVIASDVFDPALSERGRGCFDVITSIATFEHVSDFKAAFSVCLDALSEDGFLLFEVPLMSDHRDNKDWLHGSYEHVFYPTTRSLEGLFRQFPAYQSMGFESAIIGYGSTYVGLMARDRTVFERARHLLEAATQASPAGLPDTEASINLAYQVVHSFDVTSERVLALPVLIRNANANVMKRLFQLWHADRVVADTAVSALANAEWHATQAANWQQAWDSLNQVYQTLQKGHEELLREVSAR